VCCVDRPRLVLLPPHIHPLVHVAAPRQAYAGFSGSEVARSATNVSFTSCTWGVHACSFPSWQVLYKPLPGGRTAVLIINSSPDTQSLSVQWSQVPGLSAGGTYRVRDVWAHAELGSFTGGYTAIGLTPHDSAFLVVY